MSVESNNRLHQAINVYIARYTDARTNDEVETNRTLKELNTEEICPDDILHYINSFDGKTVKASHLPCIFQVFHVLYKQFFKEFFNGDDNDNNAAFTKTSVAIIEKCLQLPDMLFPVLCEDECASETTYKHNLEMNPVVLASFFRFYMSMLSLELNTDNKQYELEHSSVEFQKFLLKKTIAKSLILACSRIDNHPWTNDGLRSICSNLVEMLCAYTKHKTVSSLLSGINKDISHVLFPNGLLEVVLQKLSFQKDTWKKQLPLKHALIWCITKVRYPYLSQHIPAIVPALLLLTDDYDVENKLLGISSLQYLVEGVNPADLRLYNHADVIYDALFAQLYSSSDRIYEISFPCLLKVLFVLESKPSDIIGIKFSKWDTCFEKILQNVEYTNKLSTRRILLKIIPDFICQMGGNVIKHLDRIINVVVLSLEFNDGKSEEARLHAVKVLFEVVKRSWSVLQTYESIILKCLLKFLVGLNTPDTLMCSDVLKNELENKTLDILMLLRICCGKTFDQKLKEVIDVKVNARFVVVQKKLTEVLEANVKEFHFRSRDFISS